MVRRFRQIRNYSSFVKINHTVFSLPFALIGFSLAIHEHGNTLNLRLLALVVLCVLFARNAAMGFNRYADREFDRKNPRTALREMPRDIIRPKPALYFVLINALLFILCASFINPLCLALSPVALFVVLSYSMTKRFTFLSHLFLGLSLALAPIGAYLAVAGRFAVLPLLYSFAVIFWVAAFDILYALQDEEFDKTENLKSIPVHFGKKNALVLSALFHVVSVALVAVAGLLGTFHYLYWIGAGIFALIMIYEHVIVKPDDLSRVDLAFATMNGMASLVFAGFVITDIFLF
jgi:4-hydroxybenzoate polyprenyltransferase